MENLRVVLIVLGVFSEVSFCANGQISSFQISGSSQIELDASSETNEKILLLPPRSFVSLIAVNVTDSVRFVLIQAHSHLQDITLSYEQGLNHDRHINGTNLGLLVDVQGQQSSRPLYLTVGGAVNKNVSVLAFVRNILYTDPIPGACNIEFPIELSPFLRTHYTNHTIVVEHQKALPPFPRNSVKPSCDAENLDYELFHFYLPAMDFSEGPYFNGILAMSRLRSAREKGREVRMFGFAPKTRSRFANYRGIGHVFTVVASYKLSNHSSAVYVPSVSYGCNPSLHECGTVDAPFSKALAAFSFIVGLFLAFFGHRYFRIEMFLVGFLVVAVVSYMVFGRETGLRTEWVVLIAAAWGIVGGAGWLLLWYYKSEPALSILLPVLLLGFLSACSVYYVPLNFEYLVSDFNFWASFVSCMLVLPLFLIMIVWPANILACAIIGSFLMVAPIAHAYGSTLAYILFNIFRRATVPGYQFVILDPPFQYYDQLMFGIWGGLVVLSIVFQAAREWKKPPFPEPPLPQLPWFRNSRNAPLYRRQFPMPSSPDGAERTPLLRSLTREGPKDKSFLASI